MGLIKIFEILSVCDYITPAANILETAINDPTPLQVNSWTFFIPYDKSLKSGYNALDVERLFDANGIHHWGSQITGGEYFVSVKREDAQLAEGLLLKNGVPLNERFLGAPAEYQTCRYCGVPTNRVNFWGKPVCEECK